MDVVGEPDALEGATGIDRFGSAAAILRRHWRVAAAVAGVLVVALGAWGVRWWTHPDVLGSQGGDGALVAPPRPVGEAELSFVVIDLAPGTPTTLTFRGPPTLRFATNTAHATASFTICHRSPRGVIVDSTRGTRNHLCARLDPVVAGTTLRYPSQEEYVVATVTPTTPGRAVVTGADFDYSLDRSHWYRRGVDHVDLRAVVRAR